MGVTERIGRYREAAVKAAEFTIKFQLPDGGYIWDGYVNNAYHKQAYSWPIAGRFAETQRLLDWAKSNRLQSDGQLKDYGGDVYKLAWFVQGAQRAGRFDLSYPLMSFLLSCQAPCGGFPRYAADELTRCVATTWMGISALYFGKTDVAEKAASCAINMLEAQPRQDRFYYQMTRDGKLVTEKEDPKAMFVDIAKPKQNYYELGLPMMLMCRLHQATGDPCYLDYARRFFEFNLRCHDDKLAFVFSGKTAFAAAVYYSITGDEGMRDAACEFCDFLLETQLPDGSWRDEISDPDELLYYVDHAAEYIVWLQEIATILESKEAAAG